MSEGPSRRSLFTGSLLVGALPAVLLVDLIARRGTPGVAMGRLEWILGALLSMPLAAAMLPFFVPRFVRPATAAKFLLACGAGILVVGGVEAILRISGPLPIQREFALRPNHRAVTRPAENLPGFVGASTFTTNSHGLRGPEWDGTEEVRILTVGGSTVECYYLDDSEEWSAVLMDHLNRETGRRVVVGNAGRAGFNSLDHLELVTRLPEVERSHFVVVLCGWNDLNRHIYRSWEGAVTDAPERALFSYRRCPPGSPLLHHMSLFIHARETFRLARAVATAERHVLQDNTGLWVAKGRGARAALPKRPWDGDLAPAVAIYAGVLRSIIETTRRRGAEPVLVTQPTLYSEGMTPEREAFTHGYRFPEEGYALDAASIARALADFNAAMVEVAESMKVPCVRLDGVVPSTEEYFYDDCHFNEGGAKRVAAEVARALVPLVKSLSK